MAVTRWTQRKRRSDYLPLVTASLTLVVLLAALPSALNLPQTSPTETLEYAPVPPEDDAPPSPEGNFSSLGLGSTRSVRAGGSGAELDSASQLADAGPLGRGRTPRTKRCVGNPPKQTADPMSPPCVGFFNGDNGGATAPGVTRDEVIVLVYLDCYAANAEDGCDQVYDLAKPPRSEPEAFMPHVWRTWQRYFNERFQTYGRFVHFWVHFGTLGNSPEVRRADAVEMAAELDPFAVIADVDVNGEAYAEEWARRGKVVFMNKTQVVQELGHDARFQQRFSGGVWASTPRSSNEPSTSVASCVRR